MDLSIQLFLIVVWLSMHILYEFTILLSLFDSHSNLEEIRACLVLVLIQASAEIVVCNNLLPKFNIELQFLVDENKMSRMGRMSLKRDASTLH